MAQLDAPVKAAIFDIGATLVTGPPVAPNKVIAELLRDVDHADVASVIMTQPFESADQVCEALEKTLGVQIDAKARAGIEILWEAQSRAPVAISGAGETVLALKSRGLRIGLLSDIWTPYYRGVERELPEVIEAADSIVLSFETGHRKPEESNFLTALDELGVKPEEAIMVGDTYHHDILPAIELGMYTIWVLARPDREMESVMAVGTGKAPEPTWTVTDIYDVCSLIPELLTVNS